MKILLIGGSGYIGTVVASHFLYKNYEVHVLDNFIYDNKSFLKSFFFTNKIEILDQSLEISLKNNDYDLIVILSGLVGDPITKKYPLLSKIHNNYEIKNFLSIINDNFSKKFIFISTCSNYGLNDSNILLDENCNLNPLSLYAKEKVGIENYLSSNKWKFHYTILRFATAFGHSPRMRFDLTINEFTKLYFEKKEFEVYDSETWRPYCHTTDFARAIEAILHADLDLVSNEIFNVGSNKNNFTKQMIIEEINKYFKHNYVKYKNKGVDQRNYKVDFSKIKKILNFEPEKDLSHGINEIIINLSSNRYENIENSKLYGNYFIKEDEENN
tara:strand:+ start:145 stop:1128 length:984 start_codon:yes stop_codon:yes gene_type:complete